MVNCSVGHKEQQQQQHYIRGNALNRPAGKENGGIWQIREKIGCGKDFSSFQERGRKRRGGISDIHNKQNPEHFFFPVPWLSGHMQQVWGELGNGKKAKKIVHVKKVLRMLHVSDMVRLTNESPNTDCQYKNQTIIYLVQCELSVLWARNSECWPIFQI